MTLFVHEFKEGFQSGTLWQDITALVDTNIGSIRPHLVRIGSPAGTVTMKLQDTNGRIIATSSAVTISSIFTGTYVHGYYPFELNAPVLAGNYRVLMEVSGYAFSNSAYLGWCNDYDLSKYSIDYVALDDSRRPLNLEIWSYTRSNNMRVLDFDDNWTSSTQPTITSLQQAETTFTIANNQSSAADVTGMIVDKDDYHRATFEVRVYRKDATPTEYMESVYLYLEYNPIDAVWIMEYNSFNDNSGVTFSVVAGTGQVQYTSTNMAGGSHVGHIKWHISTMEAE